MCDCLTLHTVYYRVVNDSRIKIGIKAWFVGIGIGIKFFWETLESESELESHILVNLIIGIRIGISPCGVRIGIGIIKIVILKSDWYENRMSFSCIC